MRIPIRVFPALTALCVLMITAGCGSGGGDNSSSASPADTSAAPAATMQAQYGHGMVPLAQAAPVPSDLKCTGDALVWVNLKSKSYHEPADPFFGRTKNGKYMCKADAVTAGYHAAGAMHGRRHSPEPSATASGY